MSPFQVLLDVRRGSRFCKGGNLISMTARGPDNDDLWVNTYYSETIVSSGCSGAEEYSVLGSRPNSPLELGVSTPIRMHMDATDRSVDVEIGSVMRTGTMDPDMEIRSTAAGDFFLVTSLELFLECYAPGGGEGDTCCHIPSVGWTYRNLRYTACR